MRDVLFPGTVLGYCTNVHAGATLDAIRTNLERYSRSVRERVSPEAPMGIGLWLPAPAARELRSSGGAPALRDWLAERGLFVFTINGFPYGDFHAARVKGRVYHPNWTTPERLEYTIDLVHVLADLLPGGQTGSISTLPLGWRADLDEPGAVRAAADNLRAAARAAAHIDDRGGSLIHVDLEPEPGCFLDRAVDVVDFFHGHLLGDTDAGLFRRHLRVCHDVCHAAVMFEDDAEVFAAYDHAGIAVGKVQLSNAVRVPFDRMDDGVAIAASAELSAFGEDRYLHQTSVRCHDLATGATDVAHFDDLPNALSALGGGRPIGEWRVHYHVPVLAERLGLIETTRDALARCLALCAARPEIAHYEVETYAWDVLPEGLRTDDLAEGIAMELKWVIYQAGAAGGGEGSSS